MIDGYINWLQNTLGNKYLVVEEEKVDYNTDKNIALLSEVSGVNYRSCIVFTYQLNVLTNDVVNTMKELQEYTWVHNDEVLTTPEFSYIKNVMTQPVNVSNFIELNENYVGTINITITLTASLNMVDIKEITIDNEVIDPTQVAIGYSTVTDTNRAYLSELNETDISESSLNIQIIQPMKYSDLSSKIRKIFFGELNKNTPFTITIQYSDNLTFVNDFKLLAGSQNAARASTTINSVTFIK